MKKLRFHKRQIWPLSLGAVFALFFSLHKNARAMNAVWWDIVFPLERGLARLNAHTTVSVAEVLIISLGAAVFFGTVNAIRRRQWKRLISVLLGTGLTVYAGFCLLWGTAYYADGFQEQSGLQARGGTVEELREVTEYFARRTAEYASCVSRDASGVFAVSRAEIFSGAPDAYEAAEREFPCLYRAPIVPKGFVSSRALSALDFTGFYFPFTGESNLNVDSPRCDLPFTIAHELAHQRGIASEQECNFLGLLASLSSPSAAYRYSGWLSGYVYAANALYRADHDAWKAIRDSLPETVRRDLSYMNWYWAQFEGPVNDAATNIYDSFLKSQGDQRGVQSYGTVVDLMIAYYLDVHPIG